MQIFTAHSIRKYVLNNNKMLLLECRCNYYVNCILAVCGLAVLSVTKWKCILFV